jgi:hypothetical protein
MVRKYIEHRLMPNEVSEDAMHLALASYYECDVLLTWNCVHLANQRKRKHIETINERLGLHVPDIVTPLQLM